MKETIKMKKLMMAVAVASCAIGLNAAQVNWNSGTMYKQDASTGKYRTDNAGKVGNQGATGYLFNLADQAAYTALLVYSEGTTVDWAKTSEKVWNTYKDSLNTTAATTVKKTGFASSVALSDGVSKGAGTYYAAIIYTYTEGDKDYYVANLATASVVSDEQQGATEVYDLHTKFGGKDYTPATAITGWTAVPEPTSGLLLLLGVAGLALRRRRA